MKTCTKKTNRKTCNRGTIRFQVRKITVKGKQYYEAVCSIDGLRPTKLSKLENDCTLFENKSAILSACNARANKLSCKSYIVLPTEE